MEWIASSEIWAAAAESPTLGGWIEKHQALVFRTAWRLTGSREDAEDIAQDVFLKLHNNLGKVEEAVLPAWLYRVTTNLCLDLIRRRRPGVELEDVAAADCDVAATLERGQQLSQLARLIARLPERERACLVLRDLEGLSAREAAEILQCTEETVRSAAFHAKEKLRKWIR
jgi:RNA polymerase sigma-70 factor, ECF subfamily